MKLILGIILGVVAWFAVTIGIAYAIKMGDPSLGKALLTHTTMTALWERLAISFVGSLFAGWLAVAVSREQRAALIAAVLLLIIFVPYHLMGSDMQGKIWTSFPLWYHLTFFVSLLLLPVIGGRLKRA